MSQNVPSLTGYNVNTQTPISIIFGKCHQQTCKIDYRYNFLNYLAFT